MRRFLVLSLLISGLTVSSSAFAQEMAPFAMPQIITTQDVSDMAVDFDDSFNTIQNPYLSDTMKLNYQISLLEKLVARQSALDKIGDSYANMGMNFTPPPPPRGICQQLPANGPCLAAYPDIYSALVEERQAYYKTLEVKIKDSEPGRKPGESDDVMVQRQKHEAEEQARRAEALARRTRYQWAELTCISGQCRALLVSSTDKASRYTVRQGMKLPDGTIVESVRPGNVSVSMDGEIIKLRPAPGEEIPVAAPVANNPLAQVLSSSGIEAGDASANGSNNATREAAASVIANANASAPTPPTSATGSANAAASGSAEPAPQESPLGPSGLF